MNRNLMRKKKRKVSSILERNKKPGICSEKPTITTEEILLYLPAFSLCIQMLQFMEDTFMKKQNARQRSIVGNKKQPTASLCILYMNKAEIL